MAKNRYTIWPSWLDDWIASARRQDSRRNRMMLAAFMVSRAATHELTLTHLIVAGKPLRLSRGQVHISPGHFTRVTGIEQKALRGMLRDLGKWESIEHQNKQLNNQEYPQVNHQENKAGWVVTLYRTTIFKSAKNQENYQGNDQQNDQQNDQGNTILSHQEEEVEVQTYKQTESDLLSGKGYSEEATAFAGAARKITIVRQSLMPHATADIDELDMMRWFDSTLRPAYPGRKDWLKLIEGFEGYWLQPHNLEKSKTYVIKSRFRTWVDREKKSTGRRQHSGNQTGRLAPSGKTQVDLDDF